MKKVLRDVGFLAEAVCAIVFGVPLGLILGLFGGIAIYFFVFRILGQELAAMWRKRSVVVASVSVPDATAVTAQPEASSWTH